ncbi:aquaporin-like protein [Bisporella sp. PMI_857]|nr:aquaporin-like protein [Bisporella sp. PMI_857]
MNIRHQPTYISEVDPLKNAFRKLFELLPLSTRGHVVGFLGELIGTLMFYFMGFSGVQLTLVAMNNTATGRVDTSLNGATPGGLIMIALATGLSLLVNAWIFFRISGGLFNPVVSLGMVLIGALTIARGAILCVAQFVGALCAAYLVRALFPGKLNISAHLHPTVTIAQGVLIEMILTALVVFTIFMLAAEQHEGTFLAPIGIGIAGFIVHLVGVFWTGAACNPARALSAAIAQRNFPRYHWIYYVGPFSGGILAVIFYKLIKALEYERAHEKPVQEQILPTTSPRDVEARKIAHMSSVQVGDGALAKPAAAATRKYDHSPPEKNPGGMPMALND